MIDKRRLNGAIVVPITDYIRSQEEIKKRGPDDIKADFLIAACESIQKTAMMNRCNLSFSQTKKYARILSNSGLILVNKNDEKRPFAITEKGKRWLEQFRKLREIENGADHSNISYIT